MRDQIGISLTMKRLLSVLSTAFGLIATIPAGIGLYGIMAFHVARRTKETGIGMALGVQRSGVHRLILKEAGILAITGVAAGIPFALTLSHYSMSRLFQIEPTNPTANTGAALFLPTIALTATRMPARRIDPIATLRQ